MKKELNILEQCRMAWKERVKTGRFPAKRNFLPIERHFYSQ
jgi:hypothetical protein